MSNLQSTLDISPQKLFEVLQKEYLICILRAQIYPRQKHKDYWNKIAEMKKTKICDIKNRYNLISIFDDSFVLNNFKLKTYNEFGLPNFYYPNEKVKEQQMYWDIRNYFSINSKVKFYNTVQYIQYEGTVYSVNADKKMVRITAQSGVIELSFEQVGRIL